MLRRHYQPGNRINSESATIHVACKIVAVNDVRKPRRHAGIKFI